MIGKQSRLLGFTHLIIGFFAIAFSLFLFLKSPEALIEPNEVLTIHPSIDLHLLIFLKFSLIGLMSLFVSFMCFHHFRGAQYFSLAQSFLTLVILHLSPLFVTIAAGLILLSSWQILIVARLLFTKKVLL